MTMLAATTMSGWTKRLVQASAMTILATTSSVAVAGGCDAAKTQADLDVCAGKAFARADGALNATYRTVLGRLREDGATRALLVAAQKDWLAFRDAECAFEAAQNAGGSIHAMVVTDCKAAQTKARTDALRRLLTCGEGDVICPLPN